MRPIKNAPKSCIRMLEEQSRVPRTQHAHMFAIKALGLVYESKKVNPAEDALKKKRARMREEMLKSARSRTIKEMSRLPEA